MFHPASDDVDTRAITRRLREDGSLIGVLTTEEHKTDEELLEMSRSWDIVGRCLLLVVDAVAEQLCIVNNNYHFLQFCRSGFN